MDTVTAIKRIRKELVVKDEPWKAYKMLLKFRDEHGIDLPEEIKNSYGMVRHMYEDQEYVAGYDIPVPDAGQIEQKKPSSTLVADTLAMAGL